MQGLDLDAQLTTALRRVARASAGAPDGVVMGDLDMAAATTLKSLGLIDYRRGPCVGFPVVSMTEPGRSYLAAPKGWSRAA